MDREVMITVSGICGSGKSNIAYLLKSFLKENNFDVQFEMANNYDFINEHNFDEEIGKRNVEAIKAISSRTKIVLKEEQLKMRLNGTNQL